MKQFTPAQLDVIRQRVARQPEIVTFLAQDNDVVLNTPSNVPETGIATWNLYYFCPEHGVRLHWDRASPRAHRCPVDGHVFRGEPYDGAWWRQMNGLNAKACYQLGLLWQLTGEARYLEKVTDLLMRYATHYPGYQEHGGIPCNGPGKMNAQTLCEANCLLDFALGYDFIADDLSDDERDYIASRLLRAGAQFLMARRAPQLHNHEVKIGSAIGVIGLILEDPALLTFALDGKYGLRYQLEHGLFAEGLWFEGSVHYHFYALQGFLSFEKLARDTPWSLLAHPGYRKMLDFPLQLLLPDGTFPNINDCIAGQERLTHSHIYEFAWQVYGNERYAAALQHIYRDAPRRNIDALLYGADALPAQPLPLEPQEHVHAPGSGLTLLRNAQKGRALLIKHSPFGGEHDHYDRLSLILYHQGKAILPDLGTTGYGAKMHYAYYKNSATHNTLCVDQQNQPPATPRVLHWRQGDDFCWLDTQVEWPAPDACPDSHVRMEWNDEVYRDIRFRRRLLWLDDAIIDISSVENPHQRQLDWTLHPDGKALDADGEPAVFAQSGPLTAMHNVTATPLTGSQPRNFSAAHHGLALWLHGDATLFQGKAPANPAVRDISYLILRSHAPQAQFVCVWDLGAHMPLTQMEVINDRETVVIRLWRGEVEQRIEIAAQPELVPVIRG